MLRRSPDCRSPLLLASHCRRVTAPLLWSSSKWAAGVTKSWLLGKRCDICKMSWHWLLHIRLSLPLWTQSVSMSVPLSVIVAIITTSCFRYLVHWGQRSLNALAVVTNAVQVVICKYRPQNFWIFELFMQKILKYIVHYSLSSWMHHRHSRCFGCTEGFDWHLFCIFARHLIEIAITNISIYLAFTKEWAVIWASCGCGGICAMDYMPARFRSLSSFSLLFSVRVALRMTGADGPVLTSLARLM